MAMPRPISPIETMPIVGRGAAMVGSGGPVISDTVADCFYLGKTITGITVLPD